MYSVTVTVPADIIAAINEQIGLTPKLMTTAYNRATSRLRSRWRDALRVEPPPAANYYPIHWKSAKQRRAFFATNGFGRGIPTVRTHTLSQGWQVIFAPLDNGGAITVVNETPYAQFVVGNNRQPMFDGNTGGIPWLEPDFINVQYLEEAEEVMIQTWFTVSDIFAGVPA